MKKQNDTNKKEETYMFFEVKDKSQQEPEPREFSLTFREVRKSVFNKDMPDIDMGVRALGIKFHGDGGMLAAPIIQGLKTLLEELSGIKDTDTSLTIAQAIDGRFKRNKATVSMTGRLRDILHDKGVNAEDIMNEVRDLKLKDDAKN